ncbi:MAG: complement resistance protein TraT [Pseudodesulfovibrio sp.]|uniref:complement resistance protein TraT n=1 Tax=Pseudodesulfovibrio sp. TaxID=2035812 RepID=UPI003D11B0F5
MFKRNSIVGGLLVLTLLVLGCTASNSRMGMVQGDGGLMYGSATDSQFIVDSSLFVNNRIKVRIRNTSGDPAFDLHAFKSRLEDQYRSLGYEPTNGNDFGILLDINVSYSGQIQENLSRQYMWIGGVAGGAAAAYDPVVKGQGGAAITRGAAGAVVGATIGNILGSYVTDDTYIIVSDITLATIAPREENDGTTIIFGKDNKISRKKNNFRGYRQRSTVNMAVYAGGRNVGQPEIVDGVRSRMLRILGDII